LIGLIQSTFTRGRRDSAEKVDSAIESSAKADAQVRLEEGRDAVYQRQGILRFRVQNADTGKPVTGLQPRLRFHRVVDDFTRERADATEIEEGVYTFPFRPSVPGAHAILFTAKQRGGETFGLFAIDVAPTQVTVQAGGATYRIGAEWQPPHIHSDDTRPVHLLFEIERMDSTGPQPVNADEVKVGVMNTERKVNDSVAAAATGPGRFEAQRLFSPQEVGPKDIGYDVTISFRDPSNGAKLEAGTAVFPLTAGPSH
jgi:hypothetical protein